MFKLMIVEDQPLIRNGLKLYYDWKSLKVDTIFEAENGEEGMAVALQERPNLIITDISMPVMDGLEMIEQLRPQLPDTLFIILTGYNKFDYAQRAIRNGGVHDFLLKPLQYEEGLSTIQNCINKLEASHLEEQTNLILSDKPKQQTKIKTSQMIKNMLEEEISLKHQITTEELLLFEQIGSYIEQYIKQGPTLNMVAEHFFYNPSYLSRLFKSKLGKNYTAFVTEIKINYAKEILMQPNYSVTDVCRLCGYKSYKHFVKVFKSVTQITPTEYRRKNRL